MNHFNATEQAVFIWMVGHSPHGVAICSQFTTAVFRSRDNDGQRFRTAFKVSPNPACRLAPRRAVGAVAARIGGLEHGMTFTLWTDDQGYLRAMVGTAFGESIAGLDFETAQVELYAAPQRDPRSAAPDPRKSSRPG